MNKFIRLVIFLLVVHGFSVMAQSPKREMRSGWLTTVYGLDWPQATIPATNQAYYINMQKNQLIKILDNLKAANLNTVFFQVRSECDAMYKSSFEPWSSYLVTTRGADPGYDPLTFAIEEAHKRGMELHAWLNPYRFETQVGKYENEAGDYRQTNPDWVLEYPDKTNGSKNVSILDPGRPGVRQRIVDIVKEIITTYDVDGITFDDYFYAYGGTPDNLDLATQILYKPSAMDLHDWRRDNVNNMVADVYQAIQDNKPWVTFGLSTFGIWTTDQNVAAKEGLILPKGITGLDAYKSIYCDPIAWLRDGTVDYISPQLYWPTSSSGQDYDVLSPWWSDVCARYRKHLYVSHSLSDLDASTYSTLKSSSNTDIAVELNGMSLLEYLALHGASNLKLAPTEYGKQIQVNRDADKMGAPGSVFFRTQNFFIPGFVDYLTANEYVKKSLVPAINWKASVARALPQNIRLIGQELLWDASESDVRYVVYAIPNALVSSPGNLASADYLLDVSYQKSYDLSPYAELMSTHTFAVAVLDRFGNEYPAVVMGQAPTSNEPTNLLMPTEGQEVFMPFLFDWKAVDNAEYYQIEIACDNAFAQVVYKRDVVNSQFDVADLPLVVGNTYYWRINTRVNGVEDQISASQSFKVVEQPSCSITAPTNDAVNVAVTPEIVWSDFGVGYSYTLQVSKSNSFSTLVYEETNLSTTSLTIPVNTLLPYATYYVRVCATMGQAVSAWSTIIKFSTIELTPNVPVILSPEEEQSIGSTRVEIAIKDDPRAASFRVELSDRPDFHFMYIKVKTLEAFNYQAVFDDLSETKYYVRARANYGNGLYTAWSDKRTFNLVTTDIGEVEKRGLSMTCSTRIQDELVSVYLYMPKTEKVVVAVYSLTGECVMVLKNEQLPAGDHVIELPAMELRSGMYILSLKTPNGHKTLKIIK